MERDGGRCRLPSFVSSVVGIAFAVVVIAAAAATSTEVPLLYGCCLVSMYCKRKSGSDRRGDG
jgi:hypothetical protein